MGAVELMEHLRQQGFSIELTSDCRIKVSPASALNEQLRHEIRIARTDIQALLSQRAHTPSWNDEEINRFLARSALFQNRGRTLDTAERLAEELTYRDRDQLDMHLCLECQHLDRQGRCESARAGQLPGASRLVEPVQYIPQRCEGFKPVRIHLAGDTK